MFLKDSSESQDIDVVGSCPVVDRHTKGTLPSAPTTEANGRGGGKGNEVSAALEAATATATATLEKVRSITAGQKAMGK